jgi:hypothetical protein
MEQHFIYWPQPPINGEVRTALKNQDLKVEKKVRATSNCTIVGDNAGIVITS